MFMAVLLGSFHHHGDNGDHPDCAVCSVMHHAGGDGGVMALATPALPMFHATRFFPLAAVVAAAKNTGSPQNRAPPSERFRPACRIDVHT